MKRCADKKNNIFFLFGNPRTRFAHDTFPILSMAVFDKLVSNLSEVYYHSNPVTKQVFAPAHAPDLLYNLIWTFLFIDQEFRNPRAQPKVTCRYFVRLMQREGAGYPLEYFDKQVLKVKPKDPRSLSFFTYMGHTYGIDD